MLYVIGEYEVHLMEAKIAIDKRCASQMEREKELTSERYLNFMDDDVKAELSDNAWLKNEARLNSTIANLTIIFLADCCY